MYYLCNVNNNKQQLNTGGNGKQRHKIMTQQVFKALQLNGKTIYSYNGKVVRISKRDYKYALLFIPKKCMGATDDGEYWQVIGFGNNPQTLRSSWQSIYGHGILQVVAIL